MPICCKTSQRSLHFTYMLDLRRTIWRALELGMPPRHRARILHMLVGRCERSSRCARQASELIALIQTHYSPSQSYYDEINNLDNNTSSMISTRTIEEQCIAVLDNPDRFLSMGRTRALALATLQEAFAQAQQDNVMLHQQQDMARVIKFLERLEYILTSEQRFAHCRSECVGEEEECALLKHCGRGMELMQRIAKKQSESPIY